MAMFLLVASTRRVNYKDQKSLLWKRRSATRRALTSDRREQKDPWKRHFSFHIAQIISKEPSRTADHLPTLLRLKGKHKSQSRPRKGETLPRRVTETDRGGFCAERETREADDYQHQRPKDPFILETPPSGGSGAEHALLSLLVWNTRDPHECGEHLKSLCWLWKEHG